MKYQFETQMISIRDEERAEIQDITFNKPVDGTFRLVVEGKETEELWL